MQKKARKRINKDSWSHHQLVSKYWLSQPNGAIQDFQGEGEPAWYPQLLDQHELHMYIYLNIYIYMYILKYEGILSKHVHNSSMLRYLSHTSAKESQQKGSTRIVDLIFDPFPSTSCPSQVGPSRISRVSGEPAWYLPFLDQDELQIEINEYMHK